MGSRVFHCRPWLTGMMGAGKTTVVQTFCDKASHLDILGARFLYNKGDKPSVTITNIIPTISLSLARSVPGFKQRLVSCSKDHSNILAGSALEQFKKLVIQPSSSSPWSTNPMATRLIVIDGLDECDNESEVAQILELLCCIELSTVALKILISSQEDAVIRHHFSKLSVQRPACHRRLDLQSVPQAQVIRNVGLFIRNQLRAAAIGREGSWQDWPPDGACQGSYEAVGQVRQISLVHLSSLILKHSQGYFFTPPPYAATPPLPTRANASLKSSPLYSIRWTQGLTQNPSTACTAVSLAKPSEHTSPTSEKHRGSSSFFPPLASHTTIHVGHPGKR